MRLLIQRRQKSTPFGRIRFYLSTRLELDEEERKLVAKYDVRDAIVFLGDLRRDVIRAAVGAVLLTAAVVIAMFVLITFSGRILGLSMDVTVQFLLAIFVVLWIVVYRKIKETVTIADLINGRAFKCRSVFDIQDVEKLLRKVAFVIAQLLEDMKNWGGREVVPVAPLIERQYENEPRSTLRSPVPVEAAPAIEESGS